MTGNRVVRFEYSSSVAMRRLERRFERQLERQLEHRLERERGAENSLREGIRVSKRYGESLDKGKNGVKAVRRNLPKEKKRR